MPVLDRVEARRKETKSTKPKPKAKVKRKAKKQSQGPARKEKPKGKSRTKKKRSKSKKGRPQKQQPNSPTHYEPSGSVPGPQLSDPKRQEGSGVMALAIPAVPPAADCGTAPPCGGRLYGGPARGLTFGLWTNLWINRRPQWHLGGMKRNQPTDSALSVDTGGMERTAPPVAFFTERTLAAYLAVSDRTIRNWIRRGELPSYKLGAARRIDPADVDAFLAQRRDEAA